MRHTHTKSLRFVRRLSAHAAVVAALAALSGCGSGLVDPQNHKGKPLTTLQARVTGALEAVPAGDVRGALVWASFRPELLACLDAVPEFDAPIDYNDDADLAIVEQLATCHGLYAGADVESDSIGLDAVVPQAFELPLFTLPSDALLTVSDGARMGLASVNVYVDGNDNDQLDMAAPGTHSPEDTVIGSSSAVHEEANKQALVIYRDGALSPLWKLVKGMYDCASEPPQGFSIMNVEISADSTSVTCTIDQSPIEVALEDSAEMRREICAPNPVDRTYVKPGAEGNIPGGATLLCEGGSLYYSTSADAVCPLVGHYDTQGCTDMTSDASCEATWYDLAGDYPSWWPCGVGGNLWDYTDGVVPEATAGLDVLGVIRVRDTTMVQLDDVTVTVQIDENGTEVTLPQASLSHDDVDGNGWINAGDTITVIEDENRFDGTTQPGYYRLEALIGGLSTVGAYRPVHQFDNSVPQHELQLTDAEGDGSEGIDFRITSLSGDGAYSVAELRVRANKGGDVYLFADATTLTLIDNDGDGLFGQGDSIDVTIEDASNGLDIRPGENSTVSVFVRKFVNTDTLMSTSSMMW